MKYGDQVKYGDIPIGHFWAFGFSGSLYLKSDEGDVDYSGSAMNPERPDKVVTYMGSMVELWNVIQEHG